MGLWNKIKNLFNKSTSHSDNWLSDTYNFADNPFWGFSNQSLETNELIFSVVTRLANTLSSLPLHLYKNYDQINDDPLAELITGSVNKNQTAYSLFNQCETSRNVTGNGYMLIERDKYGQPCALWPIRPECVSVMRNLDDNSIWYHITCDELNTYVYNTEIIHVRHITPLTGLKGISPLDVLKNALNFEKAVEDFSLNEMDKKDAYIIKYDRSISPEKRQAMINDFVKMIKENGGAVVQEKGFEYDRFASNFQPSDLKDAEDITRSRIANAFNVPLSFLDGSNNSSEQKMIEFVQMTLLPIVKQYEAEFNRKLLTQQQRAQGYYFKFNINGLLRGDTAARTNFYQMMIRNGIATPNDLRKLEDMTPVDNEYANKQWISGDLYPIDIPLESRNTKPLKGGESDDTTEVSDHQTTSKQ